MTEADALTVTIRWGNLTPVPDAALIDAFAELTESITQLQAQPLLRFERLPDDLLGLLPAYFLSSLPGQPSSWSDAYPQLSSLRIPSRKRTGPLGNCHPVSILHRVGCEQASLVARDAPLVEREGLLQQVWNQQVPGAKVPYAARPRSVFQFGRPAAVLKEPKTHCTLSFGCRSERSANVIQLPRERLE